MEKNLFENKKVLWASVAVLGFFVVVLVSVSLLLSRKDSPQSKRSNSSQINPSPSQQLPGVASYPQVKVREWTVAGPAVQPASPSLQIYTFKTIPPAEEAKTLALRLLGNDKVEESNGIFVASADNPATQDTSIIVVNPTVGEISYASTRGVLLKSPESFIEQLYRDPTIKVTAQYKKKSKPGITYYEAHRDWSAVGLPILNPFGILNLPSTQPLSTLSLKTNISPVSDPDIYATTDRADSKARQSDFNTLTIGVKDENSTVATFKSNIRQIETSQLKTQPTLPYNDAVKNLQANRYSHLYTEPIGEGVPQFDKVYPNNQASIENAVVSESILTYIENPPQSPQRSLDPHYIFRGTASLNSGYKVNFVAAVPARTGAAVQGAFITQNSPASQQQGTFSITAAPKQSVGPCGTALTCPPSPTPPGNNPPGCGNGGPTCAPTRPPAAQPTPGCGTNGGPTCAPGQPTQPPAPNPTNPPPIPFATPVTPQPTLTCTQLGTCPPPAQPTQTCAQLGTCPPAQPTNPPAPVVPVVPGDCPTPVSELENIREIDGFTVGQKKYNPDNDYLSGEWYVIPKPGQSIDAEQLLKLSRNRALGNDTRMTKSMARELREAPGCPVRITGPSPTLFIYAKNGEMITVTPEFALTYTDTLLQNGAWSNVVQKEYIYYEYQAVQFSRPHKGWNVSASSLNIFAEKISSKLGLTPIETTRLKFELKIAASSLTAQKLFVGIIPQSEVDTKIPLGVTGTTHVKRIHFFVSGANQSVVSPVLSPVQRSDSMILEIGAAPRE